VRALERCREGCEKNWEEMRFMKRKIFRIMAVATAMALMAGCSENQVLVTLEASVAATEVLVGSLAIAGEIPPQTAVEITGAIAQLPAAFRQTAAELASADADAVKAVTIAGYYAGTLAALQALPEDAKVYAAMIAGSIEAFLSTLAQSQVQTANTSARTRPAAKFDAHKLQAIDARAAALGLRLAALRAAQAK
jgi:hypothetical protein